jgi:hypothetical protein
VKDKLERMQKAADVANFKTFSQHLPVGAKENQKNSGYPASSPRAETETGIIRT